MWVYVYICLCINVDGNREERREGKRQILKINKMFTNTIMKSFIIILGLFYKDQYKILVKWKWLVMEYHSH